VTDRAHPRVVTNTRAYIVSGSRHTKFTIDNLSVGGARLIGTLALRLGQRIHVVLDLDIGLVEVDAEVVRVDTPDLLEDQIAIRFVDATPEVRTALREVVARVLERQVEAEQKAEEDEPEMSMSVEPDEEETR
jgi:hypothetical protein